MLVPFNHYVYESHMFQLGDIVKTGPLYILMRAHQSPKFVARLATTFQNHNPPPHIKIRLETNVSMRVKRAPNVSILNIGRIVCDAYRFHLRLAEKSSKVKKTNSRK